MRQVLLLFTLCLLSLQGLWAQAYVEQFDQPVTFGGAENFTITQANSEVTLTGNGQTGPYESIVYNITKDGAPATIDVTSTNKVFVRVKASAIGTEFRLDLVDQSGFVTSRAGLTQALTGEYVTLEFDFAGKFVKGDAGYGGTPCTNSTTGCDVNGAEIARIILTVDPGVGEFAGQVIIDYIALVRDPNAGLGRTVFSDNLGVDSALTSFTSVTPVWMFNLTPAGEIVVSGDGTSGEYEPFAYLFRNQTTFENIDVDFVEGKNKLYVKMKSTRANTAVRIDAQDGDNYITTGASLTNLVGTEYAVYEYNFTGGYSDLGYGGTACTQETQPCPVDGTRIESLVWFINPGSGAFAGDITVDWISVGAPLENLGPQLELTYFDRFNDGLTTFMPDQNGYTNTEANSEWTIMADGTSGAYATDVYTLHDKTTQEARAYDVRPSEGKLFVRMKVEGAPASVRIDIMNRAGFTSSLTNATSVVTTEYETYEYRFNGARDGGYGGTPCESTAAPCDVSLDSITSLLFYIDAATGGYTGKLIVDYLAFGTELGADPNTSPTGQVNLADDFDGANDGTFLSMAQGLVGSVTDGNLRIVGDGSAGPYQTINYTLHDDAGDPVLANAVGSNNTLYFRARSTTPVDLRIDVMDNLGFTTTNAGNRSIVGTDWAVYTFDYAGRYQDGGYGGTACTTGPCPVDGERIATVQFYPADAVGGYNGTLEIDWISFGMALTSSVDAPREVGSLRVSPNPVSDRLRIDYALLVDGQVDVTLYDGIGRPVARQAQGTVSAGSHAGEIDLSSLPHGIYQLVLSVDGYIGRAITVVKQ